VPARPEAFQPVDAICGLDNESRNVPSDSFKILTGSKNAISGFQSFAGVDEPFSVFRSPGHLTVVHT
jgi:hypothetical protein